MKIYILFVFCLSSLTCIQAQDITLRVLGTSNYTEYAESNIVIISTREPSLEKINSLKEAIISRELNIEMVKINNFQDPRKIQFKMETDSANKFELLINLCSTLQIRIDKIHFKMPEHLFEEEDNYARLALRNANSKARIIANHLGYKIDKILNIDDDTRYASYIFDNIDPNSDEGEAMIRLIELLSAGSEYDSKSSNPSRKGGYNLWVTFNLKRK